MPLDILTADRTYFVRADGNDANDGLTDNAAGAFLTLQHAYDTALNTVFLAGHKLAIKLGAGNFDGLSTRRGILGGGNADDVRIQGAGSATVITPRSSIPACFSLGEGYSGHAILTIEDMKLTAPDGYGILAFGGGTGIHYKGIDFGACQANHVTLAHNAWGYQTGPCSISGGAMSHLAVNTNAILAIHGAVIDVSNSPNFSNGFASANGGGRVYAWPLSGTNLNTITGMKFTISPGSAIDGGGNINNLPGNAAGCNTGGWYL